MISIDCDAADKSDKKEKKEKKSKTEEKETKKDTKIKSGKPQYGTIVFPRKGFIEFDEGTYEIWLKSTYNTAESMFGAGSGRMTINPIGIFEADPNKGKGDTSQAEEKTPPAGVGIKVKHIRDSAGLLEYGGSMFDARMG